MKQEICTKRRNTGYYGLSFPPDGVFDMVTKELAGKIENQQDLRNYQIMYEIIEEQIKKRA